MLVATSFMSLASLRDVIPGVGLASVIASEQRAQISVKPEKIEGDIGEDLAEIYALLMRFRAHQSPATQRLNSAVGLTVTYGALAHYIHWLICKRRLRSAGLTSQDAQIIYVHAARINWCLEELRPASRTAHHVGLYNRLHSVIHPVPRCFCG